MDISSTVVEVSPENVRELIDKSQSSVVVFLFWTDQMPQSIGTKDALNAVAPGYAEKVTFGLIDVAKDASIAQQLGVRGIPSIRVIKEGKIADQLDGPQTEQQLREFLDPHTLSGADILKQQIADSVAEEDWDNALAVLQQAISEEPTNHLFRVECADVMVLKGDLQAAKQILDTVPEAVGERKRPETRLEMSQEAAGMGTLEEVETEIEKDPSNLELLYNLSIHQAVARKYEDALQSAMTILQTDRTFREDIGRETMVRIFNLLGNDSPIAKNYRRKMFAFMH